MISDLQILSIIKRYNEGDERAATLAEEFGVTPKTILKYIRLNKNNTGMVRRSEYRRKPKFRTSVGLNDEKHFDQTDQKRRQETWERLQ